MQMSREFIVMSHRPLPIKHQSRFTRSAIESNNVTYLHESGSEQVRA